MALRGRGTERAAADLHEHDGLAVAPREIQRGDEARALADALRIRADHLHLGGLRHPADHLAERDIGLVAGGDADGRPQAACAGQGEHMRAIGAGLAGDADGPRMRPALLEAGGEHRVEADRLVEQAQTIRANQPHAVARGGLHQHILRGGPFLAHFGEAGGEDDGRAAALGPQRIDRLPRMVAGHGDDRDVGGGGKCRGRGIGLQPLHRVPLRVHRPDLARKTLLQHVGDRAATDARGIVRCPDDGHGARPQHRVEGREIHDTRIPRGSFLGRGACVTTGSRSTDRRRVQCTGCRKGVPGSAT